MTEQELFEEVAQFVDYDPETGSMVWRWREVAPNGWNTRFAGKECGRATYDGYRRIGFRTLSSRKCSYFFAHRLAWFIAYGALPKNQIDHIDGQKANNRLKNLRDVSSTLNARNRKMPRNNTSGITGVSWNKRRGRWEACASLNNKNTHIGYFDDISEAEAAVKAFRAKHGFTETHGDAV
jgi:hypothetical protein